MGVHITEFIAPADHKKKRKDKWLFRKIGEPIVAIRRETEEIGEAFTMLTMAPGPDIVPYHDGQIVILERETWADWLDPSVSAKSLIKMTNNPKEPKKPLEAPLQ
ncbi:hypothetical protein BSY16_4708 (plasmid) [Sinorhizobium sp. RAC02]|nr:hypothetical protein BSY16_4708 [Sinorhizobium sp. RAC02]